MVVSELIKANDAINTICNLNCTDAVLAYELFKVQQQLNLHMENYAKARNTLLSSYKAANDTSAVSDTIQVESSKLYDVLLELAKLHNTEVDYKVGKRYSIELLIKHIPELSIKSLLDISTIIVESYTIDPAKQFNVDVTLGECSAVVSAFESIDDTTKASSITIEAAQIFVQLYLLARRNLIDKSYAETFANLHKKYLTIENGIEKNTNADAYNKDVKMLNDVAVTVKSAVLKTEYFKNIAIKPAFFVATQKFLIED